VVGLESFIGGSRIKTLAYGSIGDSSDFAGEDAFFFQ
jgi:hypothetical protein